MITHSVSSDIKRALCAKGFFPVSDFLNFIQEEIRLTIDSKLALDFFIYAFCVLDIIIL